MTEQYKPSHESSSPQKSRLLSRFQNTIDRTLLVPLDKTLAKMLRDEPIVREDDQGQMVIYHKLWARVEDSRWTRLRCSMPAPARSGDIVHLTNAEGKLTERKHVSSDLTDVQVLDVGECMYSIDYTRRPSEFCIEDQEKLKYWE